MAKLLVRSVVLLALAAVTAGPAFAGRGLTRKEKDAAITALEEQIHQLQGTRNAALKSLDARYDHIIRNMEPKVIHNQLEETLVLMRQVREDLGHGDGLNYGGNRIRANESIEKADHQVVSALKHETPEERAKAANDIGAVYEDLRVALAFSREHPLDGQGQTKGELERRAVENVRLIDALPRLEMAHHLVAAADHEIKDYNEEKNILRQKRDQEKNMMRAQVRVQIKELEEKINALKK